MITYPFITFQDITLYQDTGNFHIHLLGYITEIDNGLAVKLIQFIVLASFSFPLNPVRMDNKITNWRFLKINVFSINEKSKML